MTNWEGYVCSLTGFATIVFASFMAAVFREAAWHELKEYCKRRGRRQRFDAIFERHDATLLALDTLRIAGVVLLLLGVREWLSSDPLSDSAPVETTEWLRSEWPTVLTWSLCLLVMSVWLPMGIARLASVPLVFHLWPLVRTLLVVFLPLTIGASGIAWAIHRMSGRTKETEEEAFEDEVLAIVTEGLHDGHLEADAREMIEGVIELGDGDVADIMTPRSKMDAIPLEWNWEQVLDFVIKCGRTRIPVFEGSLDSIVGILYVKDLLGEFAEHGGSPTHPLQEILREPWYVPPTQGLDGLLNDFQQTRNHMAVVRDEFERTAGLVTIEDVLEEIVGEIVDETDKEQVEEIRRVDAQTALIQGRTHLADVNEILGLDLPEPDDFDTIAGYVVSKLGRIPSVGEQIFGDDVRITVLQANRRKVESVKLERFTPLPH